MYLSFTEKEFLRTVRHGDIDSYLLSMRYGLSQTSNPRVWEDLENLGAYSDSVFHGFDANRIKNSDVSGRTKEKEAFLHLESIMKELIKVTTNNEGNIRRFNYVTFRLVLYRIYCSIYYRYNYLFRIIFWMVLRRGINE